MPLIRPSVRCGLGIPKIFKQWKSARHKAFTFSTTARCQFTSEWAVSPPVYDKDVAANGAARCGITSVGTYHAIQNLFATSKRYFSGCSHFLFGCLTNRGETQKSR
jgi:hypothetical protein